MCPPAMRHVHLVQGVGEGICWGSVGLAGMVWRGVVRCGAERWRFRGRLGERSWHALGAHEARCCTIFSASRGLHAEDGHVNLVVKW